MNEVGQKSNYPGLHKGHGLPFLKALGIKKEEVSHAGVRPGQMHVSLNKDINAIERFKGVKNLFKINTKNKEAKLIFKIRKLDQLRAKAENIPKKVKILSSRMFVSKKQLEHWITKYWKIINITEAEQTFSNDELEDPSIKDFFKNSKSDDVIVEYIPNPRLNLPNILPVEGKKLIVVTNKRNRQCMNCFAKGHSAVECKNEKVQQKDYKKALNDFIKKMTNNPDIDRNDANPQADEEEEPAPTTTPNLEKTKTPTKKDTNKKTVASPKKLPEDEKETGDEEKTSCNKDPQEENKEI